MTRHPSTYNEYVKRRIFKLTLFLLAGAIINVAVALGCACVTRFDSFGEVASLDGSPAPWPEYLQKLNWPPAERMTLHKPSQGSSIGVDIIEAEGGDEQAGWRRTDSPDKVFVSLLTYRFGLPWRTLKLETHGVRAGPRGMELVKAAATAAGFRTGIDISRQRPGGAKFLPVTPLWPGFAINTIFYAAIVWGLFAVPGAIRKRVRRKRGQCAACGYSLRGSSGEKCPECGAAVPHKNTA
jgi:hypothetical protein